ncbi:MAG TPA: neutral/alkaline ceramidase [Spirochaetota bacterium]|nr:neutral/alkaline ceramidase [Spirochaetota bacterium]HOD13625.1 neutral/alkaline ceramidase [Spirochaetota bacterium]HPG50460.1 neutral/alkaline ceramidase [Spirochaetota bacterium]HPN12020.1 neutral/alkaline ceramidase [Spirochaetota bacterium]
MGNTKQAFLRILFSVLCAGIIFAPGCQDDSSTDPLALAGSGTAYNPYNDPDNAATASETTAKSGGSVYLIGSGIYDITGPAGEIVMMGFAVSEQKTAGIHLRLRSRAFVVGDDTKRVVFVSADLGQLFQMVKVKLCEKIAANSELAKYYNTRNILLSATHTHNGPGGFSGYFLYDVTVNGFVKQNFNAIVDGIYQSILRAHNNVKPGKVLVNEGTIDGCGGNRAVEAYNNNPAAERARYDSITDKTMTLLKFVGLDGDEIGMVNWYGVHPDSIGPENKLISGDNKGWASYLFEKDKGADYLASKSFVAAFAQASAGDVTPNIGFGQAPPSVTLEGNPSLNNAVMKQYNKAKELYAGATKELSGSVDFRHEWVDMRTLYVESAGCTTCAAGMGASFSAGSPYDNPSPSPLFPNGTTVNSVQWSEDAGKAALSTLLGGVFAFAWPATNNEAYKACQAEKPVLIPTGVAHLNINGPTMTPQIMPLQVLKIGNLAIVAVPTEVTTMAGRRIKNTVTAELSAAGVDTSVIASLANSYASYLATREEYAKQWYEGACTQFGPNELAAFQQEYTKLCRAIVSGADVPAGPAPEDVTGQTVDFTAKVVLDDKPLGKNFGSVMTQPSASYAKGSIVSVQYWGGHPNNNLQTQGSFLVVEKLSGNSWVPVAYDWDPDTTYRWERNSISYSKITITWNTKNAAAGTYRIRHKGHWKSGWTGKISPYEGVSKSFDVK